METGHIKTVRGRVSFVAIVSDEIRPGVAKAQFNMGKAMPNALCHGVPDPISGNYRYKLGRGALRRVGPSPWKRPDRPSLRNKQLVVPLPVLLVVPLPVLQATRCSLAGSGR